MHKKSTNKIAFIDILKINIWCNNNWEIYFIILLQTTDSSLAQSFILLVSRFQNSFIYWLFQQHLVLFLQWQLYLELFLAFLFEAVPFVSSKYCLSSFHIRQHGQFPASFCSRKASSACKFCGLCIKYKKLRKFHILIVVYLLGEPPGGCWIMSCYRKDHVLSTTIQSSWNGVQAGYYTNITFLRSCSTNYEE